MTIEERKKEIRDNYFAEIQSLKEIRDQLDALRKQIDEDYLKARRKLESDCITEYGHHKDDGGFMFGHCERCGAFLG